MMVNVIIQDRQFVSCVYQGRTTFIHSLTFFFIIIIIINFVLNMFVHNSPTQLQSKALLHKPLLIIFLLFLVSLQMQNLDTCGVCSTTFL